MIILRLSPSVREKSGISDYSSIFDEILQREGIQIIKVKYLFANRATWWLPLDFLFRHKYWENLLDNIDAIHAEIGSHQAQEILTLYYLSKKRINVRIFITVHDPGIENYRIFKIFYNFSGSFFAKVINKFVDQIEPFIDKLMFNGVLKYILEESYRIFVFNQWGRGVLVKRYKKIKEKIHILNHPIFNFPKQKIQPLDKRKIVFTGFWSRNKGIETLIEAFYLIVQKAKVSIPSLVLSGETQIPNSSYSRKIRGLVERLDLKNLVEFPGYLKENKLFKVLSKAYLVIPYTNEISGSASGVYIRGLQVGAVTIISDNPTLSSLSKVHQSSLIFRQGDVEDLSRKILAIIQNQKLSACLAKQGQEFIYKYGDYKKIGKEVAKIYRNSLR